MRDPDKWREADWKKHDAALNRLLDHRVDAFARDLDACGWKIVPTDDCGVRWPMNGPGPCPTWADAYESPKRPAPAQAAKETD